MCVEIFNMKVNHLIRHSVFSNMLLLFSLDYKINEKDWHCENIFVLFPKLICSLTWTGGHAISPHGAIHDPSWD